MVAQKKLKPGYACDETAGLYFENLALKKVITQTKEDKAYKISLVNGKAVEQALEGELIS